MPDPKILNALSTHSPSREFVADTRDLLSNAWHQPTGAPRSGDTPQGTNNMNTTLQQPTKPDSRPPMNGQSTGNHSPRFNPRWIAAAAAAALVVVGGAILINHNSDGADAPAVATLPATTTPATVPTVNTDVTPSTQTPSTQTPSTSDTTPANTTNPPTNTEPAKPTATEPATTQTPNPQTAPTPATTPPPATSMYVPDRGPAWANLDVTAPVANFPQDGVYGSEQHQVNGESVTFTLSQFFFGEACNTLFSIPPDEYSDDCAGNYATVSDPTATVTMDSTATVFADFNEDENIATYQIPAAEFARLLAGEAPDASAPAGLTFWPGPILVQVQGGKVTAVRSLAWS